MKIIKLSSFSEIFTAYEKLKAVFPDLPHRVDVAEYFRKIAYNANVYLIKNDNEICAIAAVYMNDIVSKIAYVTLIGVDLNYRNCGLGTMLFKHCEKEAVSCGMTRLRLEVNKNNIAALEFYKKQGMKIKENATDYSCYMEKFLYKEVISIIVPVYNAEACLERCIKSIINQTYQYFELLLINDGSKDSSPSICDAYAKKDERIRVIHQNNQGVSSARNIGLKSSSGSYITFIDADDYVDNDYLHILYNNISDVDMVISKPIFENKDGNPTREITVKNISVETMDSVNFKSPYIHYWTWGTLIRKDCVNNIIFCENYYVGEDSLFNFTVIKNCKKVKHIQEKKYHYVEYASSACHGEFSLKKLTEVFAWNDICNMYRNTNQRIYNSLCTECLRVCQEKFYHLENSKYSSGPHRKAIQKIIRRHCFRLLCDHSIDIKMKLWIIGVGLAGNMYNKATVLRRKLLDRHTFR